MIVYRLSQKQYANDLSGKGAELYGGRWNNIGQPMIYTAESRSLCLVEIAVHTPFSIHPKNYQLITIEFPDEELEVFPKSKLPANWNAVPHTNESQAVGDTFLNQQNALALQVPSAIVPQENNILLNPLHPNSKFIQILSVEPFSLDHQLFQSLDLE